MIKTNKVFLAVLFMMVLLVASASAIQFRPINQENHPGINNPYHPPVEGPNHSGASTYRNVWRGFSQLCEDDMQYRPINQGKNILRFFFCGSEESD